MRQPRKRLRARAERAAESWANDPKNHKDAVLRSMLSWLSGYDAARRDARKVKCAKIAERFSHGVRGPTGRRGVLRVHSVDSGTLEAGMRITGDGIPDGAVLVIPAFSDEARAVQDGRNGAVSVGYRGPECPDCGTTLEARGSNGLGVYCPNGLCNS